MLKWWFKLRAFEAKRWRKYESSTFWCYLWAIFSHQELIQSLKRVQTRCCGRAASSGFAPRKLLSWQFEKIIRWRERDCPWFTKIHAANRKKRTWTLAHAQVQTKSRKAFDQKWSPHPKWSSEEIGHPNIKHSKRDVKLHRLLENRCF